MNLVNQIKTAYANHLLLTFGADALAMFYTLPAIDACETLHGDIRVVATDATESQVSALSKALEVFSYQHNATVYFNEFVFDGKSRATLLYEVA